MNPLFGRQAETDWLDQAVERTIGGAGGATFVVGPPGLGKTRLVEYTTEHAIARDVVVAIGRAWETGGAPAGWPFVEALRAWRDAKLLDEAAAELGPRRVHLRQLHPELVEAQAGPSTVDLDASARFLVLDALADLWCALARRRPCVLVLEDLHAADRLSVELLAILSERAKREPLHVLGTYRSREARLSDEVGQPLARAARFARLLDLHPLAPEDAAQLARSSLGPDTDPERVASVVAAADGNPLFVRELARTSSHPGTRTLSGLDHVISAHVSTLGPIALQVAELASIFGRHLDAAVLRRTCRDVLELDDAQISTALEELSQRELLGPGEPPGLSFVHVLVRDALYARLSPARRQAYHAAAIVHLEQVGAPASQLAHHALAAGPALAADRILELTRRAVDEASSRFAFFDATAILRRTVQAADAGGWLEPSARLSLQLDLASAMIHAGEIPPARDLCAQVADSAHAMGDAALQARAALVYGTEFTRGTRDQRMVRLLERALEALPDEPSALRARVLGRYAASQFPCPDPELPLRLGKQALAMAAQVGDERALFEAHYFARLPQFFWLPAREFIQFEAQAIELARRVGSGPELLRTVAMSSLAHLVAGNSARSAELLNEARALAANADVPQQLFRLHLLDSMVAVYRGELEHAKQAMAAAQACTERGPVEAPIPIFVMSRFGTARALRDHEALLGMRDEVIRMLWDLPSGYSSLAAYHAYLGELDRARELLARRDADLRGRPIAMLACMAEAAVAVGGERELLTELYERLLPFANDVMSWGMMGFTAEGTTHRWLGMLAAALGRDADADRHYADAVETDARIGARPSLACVLEDWAELLIARGETDRAAGLLDRAIDVLDEIGLSARAEAARARRAELDAPAPVTMAPPVEPTASPTLVLSREGDVYAVRFGNERFSVRDQKGMRYLEMLVAAPGTEIHALDLMTAEAGPEARAAMGGDAGPLLDAQAKAAYRARLADLQAEAEEAEDMGDLARAEARREELEALIDELARATGLGGRDRKAGSPAERARVNVQRRLKAAVGSLASHSPALGEHLARALRTGAFCSYDPPATG